MAFRAIVSRKGSPRQSLHEAARLLQIPRVLDQTTGHMREGLRDHLMPPKYLLEKVAVQA